MVSVLRPGQRILNIPGIGVQTSRRAVSAGGTSAWWLAGGAPTPVAVYQPKGAASLAASYANLVNPGTYDSAPGVAPTFNAATGWTFNGSSQYLTTGVVPQIGWSALIAYSALESGSDKALWGVYDAGVTTAFAVTAQTAAMRSFVATDYDHSPRLDAGVHGIADRTAYRDGVADSPNLPVVQGGTIARAVFIGALNLFGNPTQYGASTVKAFAIWDTSTNHATWMPSVMDACALI